MSFLENASPLGCEPPKGVMPPDGSRDTFKVILADCPWKYRNFSEKKHGAVAAQYETMKTADIAAIPVATWADDDAVLAIWVTWPMLDAAFAVVEAWGFTFKTLVPWVKVVPSSGEIRRGIGFWAMSASEGLMLCTRGSPTRQGARKDTPIGLLVGEERVFYAPIRAHSQKPLEIHAWLESTLAGPYLELFATEQRVGWTCWGHGTGFELSAAGVEARPRAALGEGER